MFAEQKKTVAPAEDKGKGRGKGKRKKEQPLNQADIDIPDDLLFDAERSLSHEEEVAVRNDVKYLAENEDETSEHPIVVEDKDICHLALNLKKSKSFAHSLFNDYHMKELKVIVSQLGKEFPGKRATKQKAAQIISEFVRVKHSQMDDEGKTCPHFEPRFRKFIE